MIFEYQTDKYVKEKKQLEIEDTKNVFFKGTDKIEKCPSYLGIWTNEKYLVIAKLKSGQSTRFSYYLKSGHCFDEINIRIYLKDTNNVTFATREEFKEKLKNEASELEM